MAQHDFSIANQGFPAFRADLNDVLGAIASNSSGATEPSTTFANQLWLDTTAHILKIRNEDNTDWIAIPVANVPAGNIAAATVQDAINELDADKVPRTSSTGSAVLPSGTEGQRDVSPLAGYLRFNSSVNKPEVYTGTAWGSVGGGATGGGSDEVFAQNSQAVTTDYTIPVGKNASSVGPIEVPSGVSITVSSGSRWVVL